MSGLSEFVEDHFCLDAPVGKIAAVAYETLNGFLDNVAESRRGENQVTRFVEGPIDDFHCFPEPTNFGILPSVNLTQGAFIVFGAFHNGSVCVCVAA